MGGAGLRLATHPLSPRPPYRTQVRIPVVFTSLPRHRAIVDRARASEVTCHVTYDAVGPPPSLPGYGHVTGPQDDVTGHVIPRAKFSLSMGLSPLCGWQNTPVGQRVKGRRVCPHLYENSELICEI